MWYYPLIQYSGYAFIIFTVVAIFVYLGYSICKEFKEADEKHRQQKIVEYMAIALLCIGVYFLVQITFAEQSTNIFRYLTGRPEISFSDNFSFKWIPNLPTQELGEIR